MDEQDGTALIRAYETAHANVMEKLSLTTTPEVWAGEAAYILRVMRDDLKVVNGADQFAILQAAGGMIKTDLFLKELSGQFEEAMEITGEYL